MNEEYGWIITSRASKTILLGEREYDLNKEAHWLTNSANWEYVYLESTVVSESGEMDR